MKKLILINLLIIPFHVISLKAQTNTIESINRILNSCPVGLCFTNHNIKADGALICCTEKREFHFNENKTELIYVSKHYNSLDNKLIETFTRKIKIKDINFSNIESVGGGDDSKMVMIYQINLKKTFVTNCQGPACLEAISYGNNTSISFGPDCLEEKLDEKFIELLKKIESKK